ncbi:MAG: aminotransferase class V-fold PLP-dependent enzyme [Ignavibacteriales bacterium]|nr:aminotransferase class V-fold PLP-dependent enzyme [Ignavibacteriales bacterium]
MKIIDKQEIYFEKFRSNIVGYNQHFQTPFGKKRIVYADWIASGRLYKPIERIMLERFGPFVGNTHSESSITGLTMTRAYHAAHEMIKNHVNAGTDDVIITAGFGMTTVINKFQRILGLAVPEQVKDCINLKGDDKPVVFLTHMEHHSNHTNWLPTLAEVVVLEPDADGLVDLNKLHHQLNKFKNRKIKIGSFTSCSNVTGIRTPYHQMAKLMHEYGGVCFIDFAASAPYDEINMHPKDQLEKLDAIFFSPHKFLGGPGTPGVIVFDSKLYDRKTPDQPGGGTVDWTNPWGKYRFLNDIEIREDGGTPGFLQTIKAALCIQLKNEMNVKNMQVREKELLKIAFKEFKKIPSLHILANNVEERMGIISFYVENVHYNLVVKLLNDRYGVQVRGGCSCAGTYGHYLLHIGPQLSKKITTQIDHGDLSAKPGWVRLSLHPTTTNDELFFITGAIKELVENIDKLKADYQYSPTKNIFYNINSREDKVQSNKLFNLD